MIALYIIGAIILIIALLLFAPITFTLKYDEELNLKRRYLFLTHKYFDDEKTDETNDSTKKLTSRKTDATKSTSKAASKKQTFTERNIEIIKTSFKFKGFVGAKEIISFAAYLVAKISKLIKNHLIIKEIYVVMAVGSDDAADTAVSYGKTCSYVFTALGFICNTLKVRKYYADIHPDFIRPESKAYIYARAKIRLVFVIGAFISYLFHIIISPLLEYKMDSKMKKGGAKKYEAEQK